MSDFEKSDLDILENENFTYYMLNEPSQTVGF